MPWRDSWQAAGSRQQVLRMRGLRTLRTFPLHLANNTIRKKKRKKGKKRTDGQTDRRTDGQTEDRQLAVVVVMITHSLFAALVLRKVTTALILLAAYHHLRIFHDGVGYFAARLVS